jgi:hypothetical protein
MAEDTSKSSLRDSQRPMIEGLQSFHGIDGLHHENLDPASLQQSYAHVPNEDSCTPESQTRMFQIDPRQGFFHAMLSYRVTPDQNLVTKIHDKVHLIGPGASSSKTGIQHVPMSLDAHPWPAAFSRHKSVLNSALRIFQDSVCLSDGMGWEGDGRPQNGGFVGALRLSVVFVPLFSASLDQNGRVVGSLGQMIELADNDKQDNVLLELILAREFHLQSKKTTENALFPCSAIFPLLLNEDLFRYAKDLPKLPSKVTNAKALQILKSMGMPDSSISKELKDNRLTVDEVWSFYSAQQGMKMWDRGSETYQVEAAAEAIIQVINRAMSSFKLHDMSINYSQMGELFSFLSALNMANYTKILVRHKITNVFQFSSLSTEENSIVRLVAEDGFQASDSTLAAELFRLKSAIAIAKNSRFSKSLNDRFRDFIDEDASFATLTQSASVLDNCLSKPFGLAVLFLICLCITINACFELAAARDNLNADLKLYFPNNTESRVAWSAMQAIFFFLMCVAVLIAHFRSPRHGRYAIAFAVLFCSCFYFWTIAVSIRSAFENNCQDCAVVNDLVTAQNSVTLNILNQPTSGFPTAVAAITMLFRQDLFVSLSLSTTVLVNSIPGLVFLIYFGTFRDIQATRFLGNAGTWLAFYAVFKALLHIGNQRAKKIYDMNEEKTRNVYKSIRSKYLDKEEFGHISFASSSSDASVGLWLRISQFFCRSKHLRMKRSTWREMNSTGGNHSGPTHVNYSLNVPAFWTQEIIGEESIQQQHSSFESLVMDAEYINAPFQEWVSSWLTGGPQIDKVKKHLYHTIGGLDSAFVNLSKGTAGHVRVEDALNCVVDEDVPDVSNPDSPFIARAGNTVVDAMLVKFVKAGVKSVSVVSSNAAISGKHICGPVKHVDRAIAKVLFYTYFQAVLIVSAGLSLLRRQISALD